MQIPITERSLYIDPIPEDNVSATSDDYDVDFGSEVLRGLRDNIVHTCTRCGRSGHVAKDCFQLRSATHDSDSDNDDPPLAPVRNEPLLSPFNSEEVTDDDTNGQDDSISAHLDTSC
jgi:Zinc knuckle